MKSLRTRLLLAASLILIAFFLLTGVALESAFRESAYQAQEDKLEGLIYALLSAAEPSTTGDLTISLASASDRRVTQLDASLQAALFDENGNVVWSSAVVPEIPKAASTAVDQWQFEHLDVPDAFFMRYGFRYINFEKDPQIYTLAVMEDATSFRAQLRAYRRTLFTWLAASGACLLFAQVMTLRWGLSPLQRLVSELRAIEVGHQTEIQAEYPDELTPLTDGLNAMIQNERNQQVRYRNALGDLAHSLKTPLAVMRNLTEDPALPQILCKPLREQVSLMQQITAYQLGKAATAGRRALAEPVTLRPVAEKITGALAKVYADRNVQFDLAVTAGLRVRADGNDLFELLGNMLDNACKYGHGLVRLHVFRDERTATVTVEDNGPGFPEHAEDLLERGVRADAQVPGQGIGLAAVAELVKAYDGHIELGRSAVLGGASVRVILAA